MRMYLYIKALSDFSSRMQFIAVTSLLVSIPDAAFYLTVYFMARQLAGMMAGPLAGVWADRYSRRHLMIIAEWLSALSLAILLVTSHPYAIVASAFSLGITYTVFDVSFRAALPDMMSEEGILSVNALLVRFSSIISITGFALGGMILQLSSYKVLISFDICTYMISAVVLMRMTWEKTGSETDKVSSIQTTWNWRNVLKTNSLLMLLVPASLLYPLAASAYQYGLPLLAGDTESPGLYNGFLWSSAAVGSLMSSFFLQKRVHLSSGLYVTTLLLFAFSLMFTYSVPLSLWTFSALLFAGFFEGRCQTYYYSLLQQTDKTIRGRLFGMHSVNTRLGYFAGFLVTPFMAEAFSVGFAVIVVQAILAAAILLAFIIHRRSGDS
ncbi:MFS transporter [Priestia abyssalis]|uniref:MFS transporter n=1 Tax=Priestia abyssalis TaxID=1221450 RepID=UPI000995DE1C|nr:MFS transporter [Priestia abyssalis]